MQVDQYARADADDAAPSLLELLKAAAKENHLDTADLSAGPANAYIDHLVASPLANLLSEPSTISAEATAVEAELTNLCFREYSTFVSVHQCSAAVQSAFDDFDGSLKSLMDSVPALEDECRSFSKRTTGVQAARARALLVQEQRDKLLDLLEIPQLMETCVRNGYYQEALELAQHASVLKERFSTLLLVQDVAREVESVVQVMLAQLLALLREPVKLPTILKAVSFLRRLGQIDEADLGLLFLISRLHNFRSQLMQIERDRQDPTRYLRRYIDLFREHVYDIISQYSSIFSNTVQLISFASQCVGDLIDLTNTYVPRMASDTAALSSTLVQLGYCALSFSRIGLDFASLVGDAFAETMSSTFAAGSEAASREIVGVVDSAARNALAPTDVLISASRVTEVLASVPDFGVVEASELSDLAIFPPLALFFNANVNLLNALRLLPPVQHYDRLRRCQEASLARATDAIVLYIRQAISMDPSNTESERPKHNRTPSSPRAHLLRRSTEGQMTMEMRSAKRKEATAISLAFAQAWRYMVTDLVQSLQEGIFVDGRQLGTQLAESLAQLDHFIRDQSKADLSAVDANPASGNRTLSSDDRPPEEDVFGSSSDAQSRLDGYSLRAPDVRMDRLQSKVAPESSPPRSENAPATKSTVAQDGEHVLDTTVIVADEGDPLPNATLTPEPPMAESAAAEAASQSLVKTADSAVVQSLESVNAGSSGMESMFDRLPAATQTVVLDEEVLNAPVYQHTDSTTVQESPLAANDLSDSAATGIADPAGPVPAPSVYASDSHTPATEATSGQAMAIASDAHGSDIPEVEPLNSTAENAASTPPKTSEDVPTFEGPSRPDSPDADESVADGTGNAGAKPKKKKKKKNKK